MFRFGQVLSAPRAAVPSKTFTATFSPETPAILEVTGDDSARGVKPIVAKRSQEGVFSLEESRATTSCETRGAGKAKSSFCNVVFDDKAASGTQYARDLGVAPFDVLTLRRSIKGN